MKSKKITYKISGVNISEGDSFVNSIKKSVKQTHTKKVLSGIGHFSGIFDANFKGIKDPCLVSSVDGVGTKLKVAFMMEKYNSIGQDLVNHCVNDIAVCGATPLFFMDYFATGKLNRKIAIEVVKGISKACIENKCSIIGGETAEMPGFYTNGEFDIAGMIVGVAEKKKIIDGSKIKSGNILVALPSTGLHTNGYSLARKILLPKYNTNKYLAELKSTIGDALLKVHRSYLKQIQLLHKKNLINGVAHITGGGIIGNTNRIIPKGMSVKIDWLSWKRPNIFNFIQREGSVPEKDMRRTFNLGIGLVFIVNKNKINLVLNQLKLIGEKPFIIGKVF
ncbi:MAG: phosphoribosylformylglycinamidine cyclo-ligase [Bacteroidetes bacterium]|nr:phosphoribosylformylglycinamidine cyclo-ligase [Bacteroidota bacterium]